MCACQKSYTSIIMTSITWAGPRCVQELATMLTPQNPVQGRCVVFSHPKIPKLLQNWKSILFQCPMRFVALKKANKVKVVHNIAHNNVPHRVPSPDLEQRRGYECSLSVSCTPPQVASSPARAAQQFRFLRFKHCFRQLRSMKHAIVTCISENI